VLPVVEELAAIGPKARAFAAKLARDPDYLRTVKHYCPQMADNIVTVAGALIGVGVPVNESLGLAGGLVFVPSAFEYVGLRWGGGDGLGDICSDIDSVISSSWVPDFAKRVIRPFAGTICRTIVDLIDALGHGADAVAGFIGRLLSKVFGNDIANGIVKLLRIFLDPEVMIEGIGNSVTWLINDVILGIIPEAISAASDEADRPESSALTVVFAFIGGLLAGLSRAVTLAPGTENIMEVLGIRNPRAFLEEVAGYDKMFGLKAIIFAIQMIYGGFAQAIGDVKGFATRIINIFHKVVAGLLEKLVGIPVSITDKLTLVITGVINDMLDSKQSFDILNIPEDIGQKLLDKLLAGVSNFSFEDIWNALKDLADALLGVDLDELAEGAEDLIKNPPIPESLDDLDKLLQTIDRMAATMEEIDPGMAEGLLNAVGVPAGTWNTALNIAKQYRSAYRIQDYLRRQLPKLADEARRKLAEAIKKRAEIEEGVRELVGNEQNWNNLMRRLRRDPLGAIRGLRNRFGSTAADVLKEVSRLNLGPVGRYVERVRQQVSQIEDLQRTLRAERGRLQQALREARSMRREIQAARRRVEDIRRDVRKEVEAEQMGLRLKRGRMASAVPLLAATLG
jgi:hypothetical protein